ncbi:AI-2E family transporter [Phormidium tenue]|uniref:AI-2E family transporter n=1 Tax=Phormidium tenue NIES-30 TaxID=549789 RepID=A0A1U7JBP9_9CYAN|nr:AI-2E family transporter [Phormidium tenue]MBD2229986.1 AI-2E family transporter [Phormidium tenue FACHB-1052]OKH51163.1 AI-2E family transporter [Phormidium tenue NIES-30]
MKLIDWINLAALGIALVIIWQFRQIVLLMFAAVVITIALNSLVRFFSRVYGWRRDRAVLVTGALVLLGGVVFLGLVLPLFVSQFQELLLLTPKGFEQLGVWFDAFQENPPEWFPEQDLRVLPPLPDLLRQVASIGSTVFGNFLTFFSSSMAILLQLLLLVVLTLMMLANPQAYRRLLLRLFPSSYRRRADEILTKCERSLMFWLGGVALSSIFVATISFTGLVLLGVPYAFAHAVLAGLFNFIPNLGPTLSAVFPVFVALLQSPGKALAVIVLYVLIQNVESYWFSPMVMQKQVSLLPAATLVSQIFFATFLGPVGLVLALPLAVVCKTWIEEAWIIDVLDRPRGHTIGSRPQTFEGVEPTAEPLETALTPEDV